MLPGKFYLYRDMLILWRKDITPLRRGLRSCVAGREHDWKQYCRTINSQKSSYLSGVELFHGNIQGVQEVCKIKRGIYV